MEIQIIGRKGSGKSTLIHFLTGSKNPKGVIELADERVDWLVQMSSSKKKVYAKVGIADTPAPKSGVEDEDFFEKQVVPSSKGKDAILYCLRNFSQSGFLGEPDPVSELDLLETFIILSDLHTVEGRLLRLNDNKFKRTNIEDLEKKILADKILPILENNAPLRNELEPQYFEWAERIGLVSHLKAFAVLNSDERLYKTEDSTKKITEKGIPTVSICSNFELEICQMKQDEADDFRRDFGIKPGGKIELAKKLLEGIDLVTFLTTGPKESRAWLTKSGSKAPQAAGKIHSDLERGFIRAQVVHFEDLKKTGNIQKAKSQNLVRSEGKEYIMRDGDVVEFFFSV
ncbi:redox-regulated ATPase YchF [candidate division WOR-3 bacterium]|nr:redox-regulated ATPase YchF [candidate division WOR-3 bacterium]